MAGKTLTPEQKARKLKWQRDKRAAFKLENGYSMSAHYATGKLRKAILERDGYSCVCCGMTDEQHKAKWGRPITIDHKNKDRSNNSPENLQTLCLECHGSKDLIPRLRGSVVPNFRDQITAMRLSGATLKAISQELGFCEATLFNWCLKWGLPQSVRKPRSLKHERI